MSTRRALIVVDVQNDFCEGGALAVAGGNAVGASIAKLLSGQHGYDLVVATRDWHDPQTTNGGHFASRGEQPNYDDTWPVHCVAGTTGADLHPDIATALNTGAIHHLVSKGQGAPAYSGFEGTLPDGRTLQQLLDDEGVLEVDIVGIATDYCDRATALSAVRLGYTTRVLLKHCAAVCPDTLPSILAELEDAGVHVVRDSADSTREAARG